jgi:arylsulfatase A-like enzyme
VGCTGNALLNTPHIDSLAPSGQTAIAGSPLCTPFRSALLTGQYPHRGAAGHDVALPDGQQMISDVFNNEGYHTAYFGKWHLDGAVNRQKGQREALQLVRKERRNGFETWLGYENNNAQYDCWLHGHGESGEEVDHFKLGKYETDALTDHLIDYLDTRALDTKTEDADPFFAVLSVQPPHHPYVAPKEWTKKFTPETVALRPNVPDIARVTNQTREDLAGYYAMIENLDWNVGRIRSALRAGGLDKNTIVVFFSDHGDMHGSHGQILKCSPYEESIRIPFVIGGAVTQSDHIRISCPDIVNHVDIAPTTLGMCDIDPPDWMDGTDYSYYFVANRRKPVSAPGSAYLQLVDPGFVHGFAVDRERPWRGVVTQDGWKYAVLEGQPWMMFNLNEDPYELANLALDRRFCRKREELQGQLIEWMARTQDSFALPSI